MLLPVFTCVAYDDLESRKQVRAAAWAKPGWDECVAYTGEHKTWFFGRVLNIPRMKHLLD